MIITSDGGSRSIRLASLIWYICGAADEGCRLFEKVGGKSGQRRATHRLTAGCNASFGLYCKRKCHRK